MNELRMALEFGVSSLALYVLVCVVLNRAAKLIENR